MPTNYPTALDAFNNPSATDNLDTPGVLHDEQHANVNDAVEALQAKVGINNSANASSLDFQVRDLNTRLGHIQIGIASIYPRLMCDEDGSEHMLKVKIRDGAYVLELEEPTQ